MTSYNLLCIFAHEQSFNFDGFVHACFSSPYLPYSVSLLVIFYNICRVMLKVKTVIKFKSTVGYILLTHLTYKNKLTGMEQP